MNLHITHDNKFIDYFYEIVKELNVSEDRFVIFTNVNTDALKFTQNNFPFAAAFSKELQELIGPLDQYRNIYIHWLGGFTDWFVNRLPATSNIIWCFWGGDGLEQPSMLKNVYQPHSYKYLKEHDRFSIWTLFNRTAFYRFRKKISSQRQHLKAIRRVNYFAHYLPDDFQLIKSVTSLNAQFMPFHYASADALAGDIKFSFPPEDGNILLGNSDTLTNNHFEAILHLQQLPLGNRKIFCPLSYERGIYAKDVAEFGEKHLGSAFIPMLDFLSKEEYNKMLSGISVAVMNHNRSQALGNIASLLCCGTRIYMSALSTLYEFLKNNEFIVFSVDHDLNVSNPHLFQPLTIQESEQNIKRLFEIFGKEKQKEKIKNLLLL